eukprot:4704977-Pleurochrysis_carterae.AAC.5
MTQRHLAALISAISSSPARKEKFGTSILVTNRYIPVHEIRAVPEESAHCPKQGIRDLTTSTSRLEPGTPRNK